MRAGNGAYTNSADAVGPFAGYDRRLFKNPNDDLLSQDFQTADETGQNRYNTFASVYPVMKVSLSNSQGDGPSIDQMVDASNQYVNKIDESNYNRVRKNFNQFMLGSQIDTD